MSIKSIESITCPGVYALNQTPYPKSALLISKPFKEDVLLSMLKIKRMGIHFIKNLNSSTDKAAKPFETLLNEQPLRLMSLEEKFTEEAGGSRLPPPQSAMYPVASSWISLKKNSEATPNTFKQTGPVNKQVIDDFIHFLWSTASQAAQTLGLNPKLLIAQAALETGWGQSIAKDKEGVTSNNIFNIKTKKEDGFNSVKIRTTEFITDRPVMITALFKKYGSIQDSFNDYISLIKNTKRYQKALAHAESPERYAEELSRAGYATDPNYSNKILSIYYGEMLNQALIRCGFST